MQETIKEMDQQEPECDLTSGAKNELSIEEAKQIYPEEPVQLSANREVAKITEEVKEEFQGYASQLEQIAEAHKVSTGSSPPFSPATMTMLRAGTVNKRKIAKNLDEFKKAIDWPSCQFDSTHLPEEPLVRLPHQVMAGRTIKRERCSDRAIFAVQESYSNPETAITFLCSRHFQMLPTKPNGSFYRIFKLTLRNYGGLVSYANSRHETDNTPTS